MPTAAPAPSYPVVAAARWLPASLSSVRRRKVLRAMADIGVEEFTGHNDSPYITETLEQEGAQAGDPYCAAMGARWSREAGAPCPPRGRSPSCAEWIAWAKETGRWISAAEWQRNPSVVQPGDQVIYQYSEGRHTETVVRTDLGGRRVIRVVGANTSWSGFSRDSTTTTMKPAYEPAIEGFVRGE